jgi:hypothetical protein
MFYKRIVLVPDNTRLLVSSYVGRTVGSDLWLRSRYDAQPPEGNVGPRSIYSFRLRNALASAPHSLIKTYIVVVCSRRKPCKVVL